MLDRILIIVPGFPSSEADTTCLPAVQNYVRALARRHPEIRPKVIAMHYPYRNGHYRWHGIDVYSAGGSNHGGLQKLRTWRRAWRQITRASASLIHSFWIGETALLGALAARHFRCPHVASIGGRELLEPTFYSRILRLARFHLVAGSRHASETALGSLRRSVDAIIPLGLDVENFSAAGSERAIDVLFVGSLIEAKRPSEVISIARSLKNARFVVVGDGPERSRLEASAPSNVQFTGHIERPRVIRLMQQSKALLHPSIYESQGYVFLEALACGMHVVCRDVGAPGASSNVHRVPSGREMARTLAKLLQSVDRFPPVSVPSADESVEAYMEVYRRALGDG